MLNKCFRLLLTGFILIASVSTMASISENSVFVTFVLDNEEIAEIPVFPNEEDNFASEVLVSSFIESMSAVIQESQIQKIKIASTNDRISIHKLNETFKVSIDIKKLEAEIVIPPDLRNNSNLRFGYRSRKSKRTKPLNPEIFSGYFNFQASKTFNSDTAVINPFTSSIDSYVNFKNYVFEDNRTYSEFSGGTLKRIGTRVIKDNPDGLIRYSLGDVKYTTVGYQSLLSIGGLSIEKNFDLNPYISSTPTSRTSFLIEKPSTVQIFINNQLYRTIDLKVGKYDISDLPLGNGFSDVELKIKDIFGKESNLKFPFVSGSELLDEGLSKYSFSAGTTSTQTLNDLTYDNERALFSGYYHLGLTKNYTAGLSVQGLKNQSLSGLESYFGNRFGVFSVEIAASQKVLLENDFASQFRFKSWSKADGPIRDWGLGYGLTGKYFKTIDSNNLPNTANSNYNLFLSPKIFDSIFTTFGYDKHFYREGLADTGIFSIRGSKSISSSSFASVDFNYITKTNTNDEWRFNISYTWSDVEKNLSQKISFDKENSTSRYEVQKTSDINSITGILQEGEQVRSVDLNGYRNSSRYNLSANYQYENQKDLMVNSQSGSINFASAFAWTSTGGAAVMAPIYDSFAIFEKSESLKDKIIDVNRTASGADYSSEKWNSLIIPNLTSYKDKYIQLDVGNNEEIVELDDAEFTLLPSYRSGIYKKLDVFSQFIVTGKIVDKDGKVISLKSLYLISNAGQKLEFFTNRDGEFQVERLLPGRYILKFDDANDLRQTQILVPSTATGVYDLGEVSL